MRPTLCRFPLTVLLVAWCSVHVQCQFNPFGRVVESPPACITRSRTSGTCRPLPQCLFTYTQLVELQQQPCALRNGLFGVCCPNSADSGVNSDGTLVFRPPPVQIPDLKPKDIQQATQAAQEVVNQRLNLEQQLFVQKVVVQSGTPVGSHLNLFPTSAETLQIGNKALKNLQASIQLVIQ